MSSYMQTHARKLDLRLFEHLFKGANAQAILDELRTYQNTDGGFGHGLEPDLQLPDSSMLATTVAFQYLDKINASADDMIDKAVHYLIHSYNQLKQRWINIPPEADNYPRAPWWDYKDALEWAEWGNPSAEVLGYLLQHTDKVNDQVFLTRVSEHAVQHLHETTKPEQHEVKCYIRLYQQASEDLQTKLYDRLAAHIKELAKTDPKEWGGYSATPLTFVDSPDSPFANLFDKQVLLHNLDYLQKQMVSGDHWEPTWQWGRYEKDWIKAKQAWSGKLTVENLEILKAFGVKAR